MYRKTCSGMKTTDDKGKGRTGNEFRVIIAGSRSFHDYGLLKEVCDDILADKLQTHDIVILSGAAQGADSLGERYAAEHGYRLRRFPAKWASLGKAAGIIRNLDMARNADALIAFWDGRSPGTANMIETARREHLTVITIKGKQQGS